MNTPESQAIRIRWDQSWLDRRIGWFAFNYILKMIVNDEYLNCSGEELLNYGRCNESFPFPIINISGRVKTYSNDREKDLSFRDVRFDSSNRNEISIPQKMVRTVPWNHNKLKGRFPLIPIEVINRDGNDSSY